MTQAYEFKTKPYKHQIDAWHAAGPESASAPAVAAVVDPNVTLPPTVNAPE